MTTREDIQEYIKEQKCSRDIRYLVVHCTASVPKAKATVEVIDRWHKNRGFRRQHSGHYCGYHFVIAQDGTIEIGRTLCEIGASVRGFNSNLIGIAYAGGLASNGVPADTRTPQQKDALIFLLKELRKRFSKASILGHRDFPDVHKACPCFDAKDEYKGI